MLDSTRAYYLYEDSLFNSLAFGRNGSVNFLAFSLPYNLVTFYQLSLSFL